MKGMPGLEVDRAEGRCWSLGLLEITVEFLGDTSWERWPLVCHLWAHCRSYTAFLGLNGSNSEFPSRDFQKALLIMK